MSDQPYHAAHVSLHLILYVLKQVQQVVSIYSTSKQLLVWFVSFRELLKWWKIKSSIYRRACACACVCDKGIMQRYVHYIRYPIAFTGHTWPRENISWSYHAHSIANQYYEWSHNHTTLRAYSIMFCMCLGSLCL